MTRAITYVDNSSSSGLLEIRLFVMRVFSLEHFLLLFLIF